MVQDVSQRAWNFSDRELPTTADLCAIAHVGGVVAGAFEGREMLGFVTGLPRLGLGEPCLHSHMLAVVPEAQGRGLAVRLKLFQRRFCLGRGIRLVTWTYDPLLVKNAALNLNRFCSADLPAGTAFFNPATGKGLDPAVARLFLNGEETSNGRAFAHDVLDGLVEHGVLAGLTGPRGDVLKIRPPLIWHAQHVDLLVERLDAVLAQQSR